MSAIYHTEPPTQGKVVVKTSYGDIDIELWPKEAPLACRNFVQLCMEGYYDNTLIHRIIKDFMVQMVRIAVPLRRAASSKLSCPC
jgi:peptidyl-prolyl cis-trans isomerase SDCCAG10